METRANLGNLVEYDIYSIDSIVYDYNRKQYIIENINHATDKAYTTLYDVREVVYFKNGYMTFGKTSTMRHDMLFPQPPYSWQEMVSEKLNEDLKNKELYFRSKLKELEEGFKRDSESVLFGYKKNRITPDVTK